MTKRFSFWILDFWIQFCSVYKKTHFTCAHLVVSLSIWSSAASCFSWCSSTLTWVHLWLIQLIGPDLESLPMHVGAKNKAMRSKELPAELRDRTVSRHGAGEKLQKKKVLLHWRSPRAKRLLWLLNLGTLEQPRLFLERTERSEEKVLGKRGDGELDPAWRNIQLLQPDRVWEDLQTRTSGSPDVQKGDEGQ